ncbi:MAG: hypothetical protein NTV34_20350, partial [Proteobacteria bacterium]|nr:hypothetical protein [Pseudomonadota bacterium]
NCSIYFSSYCSAIFFVSFSAMGQTQGEYSEASSPTQTTPTTPGDADDDNVIRKPKETNQPIAKEFSASERSKACAKYSGKLVSLSGEIWKVQKCTRHQVHDPDLLFRMSRQGSTVTEADSRELAPIPIGASWESLQNARQRPCSTFSNHYVTYSFVDIYFIERCVKRLIPDYETFIQHRKEHNAKTQEIIELTDAEFYGMSAGKDITSIIDKEFAKLLDGSAGVDIVPLDEACKGVDGKFVSFYSRLYKIEKCRKREINAEAYTMQTRGRDLHLVELRPEQWLSLPDGLPWKF